MTTAFTILKYDVNFFDKPNANLKPFVTGNMNKSEFLQLIFALHWAESHLGIVFDVKETLVYVQHPIVEIDLNKTLTVLTRGGKGDRFTLKRGRTIVINPLAKTLDLSGLSMDDTKIALAENIRMLVVSFTNDTDFPDLHAFVGTTKVTTLDRANYILTSGLKDMYYGLDNLFFHPELVELYRGEETIGADDVVQPALNHQKMWIAQDDKTIFEDKYIIPALKFYRSQLAKVTPSSLPNVLGTLDAIFLSVAKEDIKPIVEQAFNEAADMARLNELYALGNTYGAEAARTAAFNRLNTVVNTAKTRVENFISKKETALQNSKNYEDSGDVLKATMELLAEYFVTWVTDDLDAVDATLADKAKRTYYAVTNEFSRLVKIARAAALVRQQDILDIPLTPPIGPMEQSKTLLENINNAKEDLFYVETFVDNLSDKTGTLVKGDGFDVAELKTRITKLEQLYRDEAARSDAVQRALALNATIYMSLADARDALAKNWNTKFAEANMIAAEKLNRRILAFQLLEKRDKGTTLTADERRAVEQAGMGDKLAVDATKAKQVLADVKADLDARRPPDVSGMTVLDAMRAFNAYFKKPNFKGLDDADFVAANLAEEYSALVTQSSKLGKMGYNSFVGTAESALIQEITKKLESFIKGSYQNDDDVGYNTYITTELTPYLNQIDTLWSELPVVSGFVNPVERARKFQSKYVKTFSEVNDPPFDLTKSVAELEASMVERHEKWDKYPNPYLRSRMDYRLDARDQLIQYIKDETVYSIDPFIKAYAPDFTGILNEIMAAKQNRASKWVKEAKQKFEEAKKTKFDTEEALMAYFRVTMARMTIIKEDLENGEENLDLFKNLLKRMKQNNVKTSADVLAAKKLTQAEICSEVASRCKDIVNLIHTSAIDDARLCTYILRSRVHAILTQFKGVDPNVVFDVYSKQSERVQAFLQEIMVEPIDQKLGLKTTFFVARLFKDKSSPLVISPPTKQADIDELVRLLRQKVIQDSEECIVYTYEVKTERERILYNSKDIYVRLLMLLLLWARVLSNKPIENIITLLEEDSVDNMYAELRKKTAEVFFFNQPIALCEYHLKNATPEDIGSPAFMAQAIAPLIAASKEAEDIHNGLRGLATTQSSVEDKERYRQIMECMAAYAQTKNSDLLERVREMWPTQ